MNNDKIKQLNCILLVDDDAPTNFVHRAVIEAVKINAHIKTTASGPEALEYLSSTGRYAGNGNAPQPGIIFLDINMPGMSGWDFIEEFRLLDEKLKAGIAIIMVSASINPKDKERAEAYKEITGFLSKPLSKESIKQVVADHFL